MKYRKLWKEKGKIVLGAKVTEVQENKVRYEKDGEIKTIDGDAILVAVGRKPNIEGLKLKMQV